MRVHAQLLHRVLLPRSVRRFSGTRSAHRPLGQALAPGGKDLANFRRKAQEAVALDGHLHFRKSGELERESLHSKKPDRPVARTHEVTVCLPRAIDLHGDRMRKHEPWRIHLALESNECAVLDTNWLRDNCRCQNCVNQDTLQRSFELDSIPNKIVPREITTEETGLRVIWPDDHTSFYSWKWIVKHVPGRLPGAGKATNAAEISLWQRAQAPLYRSTSWGSEIAENPPSVGYEEIMADDKGVGKWTERIREFGFCYVEDCPVSPKKTKELAERIAFIRETHYGGFYDFTSDLTMKDTAYTDAALSAHTDTTYFTDPAGLQMFHLLSHTSGEGGKSLLIDGFKAAAMLKEHHRHYWDILAEVPIPWHAVGNEGITIRPSKLFPVLNLDDLVVGKEPELLQIRWNNSDRGVVPLRSGRRNAHEWYEAARAFQELLNSESMQFWAQLKPGRPLIFDNWRVLHGRSAFTGKRRMCGAYINRDDYISRWRNTNFTREEVLEQVY